MRPGRIHQAPLLALAAALALAGSCSGGGSSKDDGGAGDGGGQTGGDSGVQASCEPSDSTDLELELVADGFERPLLVTSPPNDPRLFIVEQPGRIQIVEGDEVTGTFLDIEDRVYDIEPEQGLLGLAFHPDYPEDPRFFVNYTASSSPEGTGATVVAEYRVSSGDPGAADAASEVRLLQIGQHRSNHNGGMVAFGPDEHLYISVGDGGGGGDDDDPSQPEGHGQDPTTLLGTILRIDVSTAGEYSIPPDNPYAGGGDGAPEVWAYGLRNPWRFSFDRQTGDLYIGDVGQTSVEEIDFAAAGEGAGTNFGWRAMEGSECFDSSSGCGDPDKVGPITEYDHQGSQCSGSVTGGYVYRGSCLTAFQGHYFFADYCRDIVYEIEYTGSPISDPNQLGLSVNSVTSFGEDAAGELYVVERGGSVRRIIAR